ncbi:hypothetical protein BKA56DRAFT_617847 [Ilyonectria sp. MPI-CAGE-AT-0026]|nr:hypothetical protein BKA56DRAFT_617847 [Ilyonectria sp. MPI-CAGE-AT-0026]
MASPASPASPASLVWLSLLLVASSPSCNHACLFLLVAAYFQARSSCPAIAIVIVTVRHSPVSSTRPPSTDADADTDSVSHSQTCAARGPIPSQPSISISSHLTPHATHASTPPLRAPTSPAPAHSRVSLSLFSDPSFLSAAATLLRFPSPAFLASIVSLVLLAGHGSPPASCKRVCKRVEIPNRSRGGRPICRFRQVRVDKFPIPFSVPVPVPPANSGSVSVLRPSPPWTTPSKPSSCFHFRRRVCRPPPASASLWAANPLCNSTAAGPGPFYCPSRLSRSGDRRDKARNTHAPGPSGPPEAPGKTLRKRRRLHRPRLRHRHCPNDTACGRNNKNTEIPKPDSIDHLSVYKLLEPLK